MEEKNEIIEGLAKLEHTQWVHWTKYMLDNLTPKNIERWKRQIKTPYSKLTEKEKDSDRVWAYKVLKCIYDVGCPCPCSDDALLRVLKKKPL